MIVIVCLLVFLYLITGRRPKGENEPAPPEDDKDTSINETVNQSLVESLDEEFDHQNLSGEFKHKTVINEWIRN